jgi:hypothetical protein
MLLSEDESKNLKKKGPWGEDYKACFPVNISSCIAMDMLK